VLEAQQRRVGRLDEDGPEDLHVLAGARLDVLVQDVDAPLCSSQHAAENISEHGLDWIGLHAIDRRSKHEH